MTKRAIRGRVEAVVLPCPFCGATGEAVEHKPYDSGVLCNGCGVWMPSRASTESGRSHGALEMWNHRQNARVSGAERPENAHVGN